MKSLKHLAIAGLTALTLHTANAQRYQGNQFEGARVGLTAMTIPDAQTPAFGGSITLPLKEDKLYAKAGLYYADRQSDIQTQQTTFAQLFPGTQYTPNTQFRLSSYATANWITELGAELQFDNIAVGLSALLTSQQVHYDLITNSGRASQMRASGVTTQGIKADVSYIGKDYFAGITGGTLRKLDDSGIEPFIGLTLGVQF